MFYKFIINEHNAKDVEKPPSRSCATLDRHL